MTFSELRRIAVETRPQNSSSLRWWFHTLRGIRFGVDLKKWEFCECAVPEGSDWHPPYVRRIPRV